MGVAAGAAECGVFQRTLRENQRGEDTQRPADGVVGSELGFVSGHVSGVFARGVRDVHVEIGLEPRQQGRRKIRK
jgi:hypothetical protein